MVPWYGMIWIMVCTVSVWIKLIMIPANLHGAKLWVKYPWTGTLGSINDAVFLLATGVAPVFIYGFIGEELDTIVITMNRSNNADRKNTHSPKGPAIGSGTAFTEQALVQIHASGSSTDYADDQSAPNK